MFESRQAALHEGPASVELDGYFGLLVGRPVREAGGLVDACAECIKGAVSWYTRS
jgi:hypothetical protein